MLPMMGGMLLTSISSGQIISRTGRYKMFPVIGTGVMSLGLLLLSRMTAETSTLAASGIMLVMGLGLGMVMQVLVIAVQNAVDYRDLGVATSGATLFRLIGGSVGTAVLGAIFATRLGSELARRLPPGTQGAPAPGAGITTELLASLSPAVRAAYADAFSASLSTVFVVATVVAIVGVRAHLASSGASASRDDLRGGDGRWRHGRRSVRDAGESGLARPSYGVVSRRSRIAMRSVSTWSSSRVKRTWSCRRRAAWLLVRLEQDPGIDAAALARTHQRGSQAFRQRDRSAHESSATSRYKARATTARKHYGVTSAGCEVLGRLIAVRRAHLDGGSVRVGHG